ncbi:MAG: hypothetical protein KAG97_04915 [Victivallales bacterium]|nr:hypothetical protein [Victivallales bacterium]
MIKTLEHRGGYILDTSLDCCQKANGVMPSHPKIIHLSENRFLVVLGSRGFLGVDDDQDIIYQVREGSPVGAILNEGVLARAGSGWDPMSRGDSFFKSNGTPIAFGVPKGATIDGELIPHHNHFVIKWYTYPKIEKDGLRHLDSDLTVEIIRLEWVQCRLNDAEDDIEIIHGPERLRQVGYETGEHFCSLESLTKCMNHSITPAVPYTDDSSEWVEVDHFYSGILAPVRYKYDTSLKRYQWVETGPATIDAELKLSEANICKVGDEWLVASRTNKNGCGTAWWKTNSLFGDGLGEKKISDPTTWGPRMMFGCPDGVVRIFSGSMKESPYGEKRNPLFCWEVDTETFELSNRRTVFDFYEMGLYDRNATELEGSQGPFAGFTMLGPWNGNTQILTHRVTKGASHLADHPLTPREIGMFGSYYSEITYEEPIAPQWEFK